MALHSTPDLDLAFVTPWQWRLVTLGVGERAVPGRVVVHHHKPGETVPGRERVVPSQGEVIVSIPRAGGLTAGEPPIERALEPFPAQFAEAKTNASSGPGQTYMRTFSERFSLFVPAAFPQCAGEEISTFDMALRLDVTGAVAETVVRPQSKWAACMAKLVARETFPPPPQPGYWVPASFQ